MGNDLDVDSSYVSIRPHTLADLLVAFDAHVEGAVRAMSSDVVV